MRLKDFLDHFDSEYVIIWENNTDERPTFEGWSNNIPYYLIDCKIIKEDKDGNKGLSFRKLDPEKSNGHDHGLVIIIK